MAEIRVSQILIQSKLLRPLVSLALRTKGLGKMDSDNRYVP